MTDTVTVPRWALEYVLQYNAPLNHAEAARWESACKAIRRALDAKTETPDEPAKSGPPKGWYPDHSWR